MPSFIIGKKELVTDFYKVENGTNAFALAPIRGYVKPGTPGTTVFLDDVAKVHVLALDKKVLDGDKPIYDHFLTSSGGENGTTFDNAIEIVRKNFPKQTKQGLFPLTDTQPAKRLPIDSSRREAVFRIKLAWFEEQVNSVVKHYIELADAASINNAQDIVSDKIVSTQA
jgi:hypothetical protein